jgi:pyrroline-5-carboxylate reductase
MASVWFNLWSSSAAATWAERCWRAGSRGGLDPARVTVVDPVLKQVPEGVTLLRRCAQASAPDTLLLGVKPQMLAELAPGLAHLAGPSTQVLSILAGVELASLARLFPGAAGHVRIMPNLAAAIGKSPVALAAQGLDDETARGAIAALMEPLGTPLWFDESLFDAVTALTGSGRPSSTASSMRWPPGTALGLEAGQARLLALAMTEGAGAARAQSPHGPGELARPRGQPRRDDACGARRARCRCCARPLVARTLRAARDRSAEMARESAS